MPLKLHDVMQATNMLADAIETAVTDAYECIGGDPAGSGPFERHLRELCDQVMTLHCALSELSADMEEQESEVCAERAIWAGSDTMVPEGLMDCTETGECGAACTWFCRHGRDSDEVAG
jgi:hypothetical protein